MIEHTNKRFEADLEDIRSRFLRMGGLVESMIADGIDVLATGNTVVMERIFEREREVNQLEVEIDQSITQVMALNQPTAVDLRLLLSVSKMLTDMERSGDEAEKIAKMARRLHETNQRYEPVIELRHMAASVISMLNRSLDAFARRDPILAAEVVRSDKLVDKEWKGVLRELISYMIEDPRTISGSIDLLFIARALERIGDHAKNMAERVIYLVQGEDVRHMGVKNTELLARGGIEAVEAARAAKAAKEAAKVAEAQTQAQVHETPKTAE
ncbi:MAG: phosphate signaling complex protein PhoU [Advenella sp.]|nr:phosphate signaling complex protein PhoU [Advenella sp.]